MRTKQIKVNNQSVEALLVAGGRDFKIYTAKGIHGWLLIVKKKVLIISNENLHFETIEKYVTVKYQPLKKHASIYKNFEKFISKFKNITEAANISV